MLGTSFLMKKGILALPQWMLTGIQLKHNICGYRNTQLITPKSSQCGLTRMRMRHIYFFCIVPQISLQLEHGQVLTSYSTLRWRHNDHDSVSNHQPHGCLFNRLFGCKSKKTSKLRVTGLLCREFTGTGEFPAQRASYAENVSIWWRHHDSAGCDTNPCPSSSFRIFWVNQNYWDIIYPNSIHLNHLNAGPEYICIQTWFIDTPVFSSFFWRPQVIRRYPWYKGLTWSNTSRHIMKPCFAVWGTWQVFTRYRLTAQTHGMHRISVLSHLHPAA